MRTLRLFISYSHRDRRYKDLLVRHLNVLEVEDVLEIFHDDRIVAGANWAEQIGQALALADIGVLLVSPDFLTSPFIRDTEVPALLQRATQHGTPLLPVIVRPCQWQRIEWLRERKAVPLDGAPLSTFADAEQEVVVNEIVSELVNVGQRVQREVKRHFWASSAVKEPGATLVSTGRLPTPTTDFLAGRERYLEVLDEAWSSGGLQAIEIRADGGVGKSALVWHWLDRLRTAGYPDVTQAFDWSFYSLGHRDYVSSSRRFFERAREHFGRLVDLRSDQGAGRAVAEAFVRTGGILVLDGLEPLQHPPLVNDGRVHDDAMQDFLQCVRSSPAWPQTPKRLLIITTRWTVPDFKGQDIKKIRVENLAAEDGAKLLMGFSLGNEEDERLWWKPLPGSTDRERETFAEFKRASVDFGGHALALVLLASYLIKFHGGDLRSRDALREITGVEDHNPSYRHARRVMRTFERMFAADGAPLTSSLCRALLYLTGLFDRPFSRHLIDGVLAATAEPPTAFVGMLSEDNVSLGLSELRRLHLVSLLPRGGETLVEAHPLIREHFAAQFRKTLPSDWYSSNMALYHHFASNVEHQPSDVDKLSDLFRAIAHRCNAGEHSASFVEVYKTRVLRTNEHFTWKVSGSEPGDLEALAHFYAKPWTDPVDDLTRADQAELLNETAYDLQTLGRTTEAIQAMTAGLKVRKDLKDWKEAAREISNLCRIKVPRGELAEARELAREGVEFADRSGDPFQRVDLHCILGEVLHMRGQWDGAVEAFEKAEHMQVEHFGGVYLDAVRGVRYAMLLLDLQRTDEALLRAESNLVNDRRQQWRSCEALDLLLRSRCAIVTYQSTAAPDSLAQGRSDAYAGMRLLKALGRQDYLPLGLLAVAQADRLSSKLDDARAVLQELEYLIEDRGLHLYVSELHLARAQLHLAGGDPDAARQHFDVATEHASAIGYRARERALAVVLNDMQSRGHG